MAVTNAKDKDTKSRLFTKNTTFHVVGDIYKSRTVYLRGFWITLLVACIITLITGILCQIHAYIESEVDVAVEWKFDPSMPMPHMAVCYFGGLDKGKLRNSNSPMWIATMHDVQSSSQRNFSYLKTKLEEDMKRLSFKTYKEYIDHFSIDLRRFIDRKHMFGKDSCNGEALNSPLRFYHHKYLTCYELCFENQTYSGVDGGAHLSFTDPSNGSEEKSLQNFGIYFFSPAYSFDISEYLFTLGYNVKMMLKRIHNKRVTSLGFPRMKKRCVDTIAKPYKMNCGYDCWLSGMERAYNCNAIIGRQNLAKLNPDIQYCTILDMNQFDGSEERKQCQRACLPDCETVLFEATVSMVPNGLDVNRTKVSIGYPRLVSEVVTEHVAYPISDLVSNIGGQLGVWLGCSLASLIQAVILCTVGYGRYPEEKQ